LGDQKKGGNSAPFLNRLYIIKMLFIHKTSRVMYN
jgi:hypothetical protein